MDFFIVRMLFVGMFIFIVFLLWLFFCIMSLFDIVCMMYM